jgi:hypothetical protein
VEREVQIMAEHRVTDQDLSDALASGEVGSFTSPEAEAQMREWVRQQQDLGRDLKTAENAIGLYVLTGLRNSGVLRTR